MSMHAPAWAKQTNKSIPVLACQNRLRSREECQESISTIRESTYKEVQGFVLAACLGWIASWAGLDQFVYLNSNRLATHYTEAVRQQISACRGSFKERYDCREGIILEGNRSTFLNMIVLFVIVFGPPIGLGIVYSLFTPVTPSPSPSRGSGYDGRGRSR
ncbi:MAG: hypothetical protein FD153_1917 [Rhodospirillaceae bacterium]|nr:MAG: hypothetical protein FD153_1917 [Rhodospirillaceae bacterium]